MSIVLRNDLVMQALVEILDRGNIVITRGKNETVGQVAELKVQLPNNRFVALQATYQRRGMIFDELPVILGELVLQMKHQLDQGAGRKPDKGE